mmetsp:Transcript_21758/g.58623  ORF Transcript_21758/g.58623 Transcript_21758/m.58623 type:complete len:267 (-) Transcript_21758:378-1178(-)
MPTSMRTSCARSLVRPPTFSSPCTRCSSRWSSSSRCFSTRRRGRTSTSSRSSNTSACAPVLDRQTSSPTRPTCAPCSMTTNATQSPRASRAPVATSCAPSSRTSPRRRQSRRRLPWPRRRTRRTKRRTRQRWNAGPEASTALSRGPCPQLCRGPGAHGRSSCARRALASKLAHRAPACLCAASRLASSCAEASPAASRSLRGARTSLCGWGARAFSTRAPPGCTGEPQASQRRHAPQRTAAARPTRHGQARSWSAVNPSSHARPFA